MLKLKEYMTIILLVRIWLHIIWSFVSIKNKQSKILNLHKNRIETTRNERSCKILQNQFVNPVNPFVSYLKDQKLPHSNESKSQFYRKKLLEIGCKSKYNENKYGSTDIHDLTTEIDDPKNSNLNILNEPRFFYSNSTKLAYCELTKCASTNWKQTMIIIELYHRYLKISKDLDNFNITKEEGFNFLPYLPFFWKNFKTTQDVFLKFFKIQFLHEIRQNFSKIYKFLRTFHNFQSNFG